MKYKYHDDISVHLQGRCLRACVRPCMRVGISKHFNNLNYITVNKQKRTLVESIYAFVLRKVRRIVELRIMFP